MLSHGSDLALQYCSDRHVPNYGEDPAAATRNVGLELQLLVRYPASIDL